MKKLWVYLRSFLQWWIGGCVLGVYLVILIFISFFLSPFKMDPILRIFCRHIVFLAGLRVKVIGLENLDPKTNYVFLFNHINRFDHFVLYWVLGRVLRGIEKEDHFRWPLYGYFLRRIGQIPIPPRGSTQRAMQSLEKASELFRRGVSIAIAPEGTRTTTGELGRFKKGAFHLAVQLQASIVPLVFLGMYEFSRRGSWLLHPREITLRIETPIPTLGLTSKDVSSLSDQVRTKMLEHLNSSSPT